jgi:protein-S-isoprenylcysteine O-methyltransferase Ste14
MFWPYPISLLQFGLFWVIVFVGSIALFRAVAGKGDGEKAAKRSRLSTLGIALQAIGFGVTGFGPIHFALPWSAPSSLICSALVALLGGSAVAIFIAATRAMGKNWSVVARTRADHQLVRTGPFAVVRHPIYLALFLYLLSFGIAFGHFGQFVIAVPFYLAGTIIRIRIEETMLRAQFGQDHARYVREVPAFIPFIG